MLLQNSLLLFIFSRICGFKPSTGTEDMSSASATAAAAELQRSMNQESLKEIDAFSHNLTSVVKDVDYIMGQSPCVQSKAFQAVGQIRDILLQLATNPRDSQIVLLLINRTVELLLHAYHEHTSKAPAEIEWSKRLMELFVGTMRVLLTQFSQVNDLARRPSFVTLTFMCFRQIYKYQDNDLIYLRCFLT